MPFIWRLPVHALLPPANNKPDLIIEFLALVLCMGLFVLFTSIGFNDDSLNKWTIRGSLSPYSTEYFWVCTHFCSEKVAICALQLLDSSRHQLVDGKVGICRTETVFHHRLAHRHAVVGNTTILEGLCDDRHVSGLH